MTELEKRNVILEKIASITNSNVVPVWRWDFLDYFKIDTNDMEIAAQLQFVLSSYGDISIYNNGVFLNMKKKVD